MDADLILGAVSDSATLVIIGRERSSNLLELPPLNVETILLIASIKDGELSQSLDVNDLLAGKMASSKDWCPTYLSPQLEHTEFGHLLTITDILLKDWSENGTLHYVDYDYPKPSYFPFDKPLFSKLGLNELVYNWNTANTMFAYDYDALHLYALNRTGSLPVSYFNSQHGYISAGRSYENRAYDYFSGLCNTDLIRVVQYTSLYQIFMDNGITNANDSVHYAPKNKAGILISPCKTLLTNIRNLSPDAIDTISRKVGKKNYEQFHKADVSRQLADWERENKQLLDVERKNDIFENTATETQGRLKNQLRNLQQQLKNTDDVTFDKLCRYLAYPRSEAFSNKERYQMYRLGSSVMETIFAFGKPNLKELGVNLSDVKNDYSSSLKNSCSPWMKTPSMIISYNSPRLTGGHNLSSKIRRVNNINADKSIISERRTQYVPSGEPQSPKGLAPRTRTTSGNMKPKSTVPASPLSGTPVRKRNDVIPTAERAKRGF